MQPSSSKVVDVFKERHVVTNFWTERSPFGIAFSPALSITAAESQTSTLRLSAPVTLTSIQNNRESCKLRTLSADFSRIKLVHIHHLCLCFSFCSSIAHSQRHTGIQAFYSASVGWCGRHYGSTASPSSDWISDQYPVPCWPASSSRTVCLWEPLPGVPYKKKRTVASFNSACWRAQMKYCLSFVNDRIMFLVCVFACHSIQTYQIVHIVRINAIHT